VYPLSIQHLWSLGIILIDQLCPVFNPNLWIGPGGHAIHFLFQTRRFEQPCNPPLLQTLLGLKRLDLNTPNAGGLTPLMVLLTDDSVARSDKMLMHLIELLSGDTRCDINAPGIDGITPLYLTIAKDKMPISKILLANGALSNQPNTDGKTPISEAIAKRSIPFIRLLFLNGANPYQWLPHQKMQALLKGLPKEIRNEIEKWGKKGAR
jgi:hypothetical protein